MTITISESKSTTEKLGISQLIDGRAYRNVGNGKIYIANEVADILAFSIDGFDYIHDGQDGAYFEEVDLLIQVIEK